MASKHEVEKSAAHASDADIQDVAIGESETIAERTEVHAWTWSTFRRSVLLQMILFGLQVIYWHFVLYLD